MSWEQYLAIGREAHALATEEKGVAPIDCPLDGTTLQPGPHGELFCSFDGWQWPRDKIS